MTDPFATNDHENPHEVSARRFAYSVLKALETADIIETDTHKFVKCAGGFAIKKKEN
jgi:hypothetical protein